MTDQTKSENELLDELGAMRERVAELEESEGQRRRMEEMLTKAHDEMVQRMEDLMEVNIQLQRKIKERKEERNITKAVEQTGDITERKRAEEMLVKNEEKFRLLYENAPLGYQSLDEKGNFLIVNQAWLDLLWYSEEEVIGKSFGDFLTPEGQEVFRKNFPIFKSVGKTDAVEFEMIRKDGQHIIVSFDGCISYDSKGRVIQIHCILNDITERKRAGEALQESEEKYRLLFEAETDAIMVFDAETRQFLDVNDAAIGLYGYRREEFLSLVHTDITVEEKASDVSIKQTAAGKPMRIPLRYHKKKDGSIFPVEISASSFLLKGRKVICGIIRDITERKQAEEALRESEETYRALVEGLPDIVMRFDRDGRHLFVSENVEQVVDIPAARFVGKTHRELGFPEDLCRLWEDAIRKVFDSGAPYENEFSFEGKHGAIIFNWRISPERDDQGAVRSALSISRDITAHHRLERDYQMLFNKMLDGFALHEIICDTQGKPADYRFLAVNQAFESLTGLKAENVVGKTVLEVLPDIEPYWIETYGRVALTGEPAFFENYAKELDKLFVVTAFRPAPNQFACIFTDITERKRMEDVLKESEERYIAMFQGAAEGILIADVETKKFKYANPAICKMLGYTEEELKRMSVPDIHPQESLDHALSEFEAQVRGEITLAPNIPCWRKNGAIIYADISSSRVVIDGRECNVGFFTDVTEHIRDEQEIENLARFISEDPHPVLRIALDGTILYANPASQSLLNDLGNEVGEVISLKWRKLTSEALRSGSRKQTDIKHRERIISFVIVPVQEAGYVNWYGRDVTKQRKLVEQERMHREELSRVSQAYNIGQMASGLAHELNQPLCAIANCAQGCLRMIQRETQNPDILRGMKELVKQSKRAGDIVHSIRGFVSKQEPRKSTFDINVALQEAVKINESKAAFSNVSIQLNLGDSLPPILGDPVQIEQVILNLIQNAFEAMEETSSDSHKLNITTSLADNDAVEVAVSDTGKGLQPEIAEQMFNSFYTTKPQGMGIGLSLCRSIIGVHQGRIWATPNQDRGTTFRFTLPVSKVIGAKK